MRTKVLLSADRTCDLNEALEKRYQVMTIPYHVLLDGKEYRDSIDLFPDDIFTAYRDHGSLPKTAAINVAEYLDHFKPFIDEGYEVVHLNLASTLSSSHQNCRMAAELLGGVYAIDSKNLSTGTGNLVLEAARLIAEGKTAAEVAEEVSQLTKKNHASFIIDTLEFLRAGGRCSSLAELGANLLKLKPCIDVDSESGQMGMGKLYRGGLDKVLAQYTEDLLKKYPGKRRDHAFITHSGISQERIDLVHSILTESHCFDEIYVTHASCTISSHCGPNTLGVIFMTE